MAKYLTADNSVFSEKWKTKHALNNLFRNDGFSYLTMCVQ